MSGRGVPAAVDPPPVRMGIWLRAAGSVGDLEEPGWAGRGAAAPQELHRGTVAGNTKQGIVPTYRLVSLN